VKVQFALRSSGWKISPLANFPFLSEKLASEAALGDPQDER
jgi:hypothetical protein